MFLMNVLSSQCFLSSTACLPDYLCQTIEALKIRKSIHGQQHEAVAAVLQELGDLMDDLGEYESAISFYVDALAIRRSRLGAGDTAVAETLYRYVKDQDTTTVYCLQIKLLTLLFSSWIICTAWDIPCITLTNPGELWYALWKLLVFDAMHSERSRWRLVIH